MIIRTLFFPFDIRISRVPRPRKSKELGYKVFCIGKNKTGTTSIKAEFIRQGFRVGDQRAAEKLAHYYNIGYFDPIIQYCHSAEIFQDVPFSLPETYKYLDVAFPDAKYILTIRDSPSQHANSVINFAKKRFGGQLPNLEDIKKYDYVHPGWSYNNLIWRTGNREMSIAEKEKQVVETRYNAESMMDKYTKYNEAVKEYFKDRPEKLLVINVAKPEEYKRFCEFFGLPSKFDTFPWKNKT